MRRITALTSFALACLSMFGSERIAWAAAAPVQLWEACYIVGVGDRIRPPVYVSGAVPIVSSADYEGIGRDFSRFILANNSFPPGMTPTSHCMQGHSPAEALSGIRQPGATPAPGQGFTLDCTRADCVMTDWTRTRAEIPGGVTTAQNATGNPAGGAVNNKPLSGNVGNPAGGAPVTSYTVCSSANNLSTVYISAAFAVTEMDGPAWSNAFTQFLAQNYAYQGAGVGCNNMTLNNAPTFLRNRVAALRAQKKQVVETGWTYGVSAALPVAIPPLPHQDQLASLAPARSPPIRPAPAAPTRASPQTTYAFCWGGLAGLTHVAYFGTPFEAPVRNVPAWSTAYKEFLRNKYKFAGVIHCGTLKSLDEAQQRAQQEEDAMQAHWKIIETGWKYE